ncbi:MAG: hypothetical protein HONBIEJF_01643 [Fimbriimonadaceae bacterium]|nr:hypothetical protein [Fimbriimonadaceae bacterium]
MLYPDGGTLKAMRRFGRWPLLITIALLLALVLPGHAQTNGPAKLKSGDVVIVTILGQPLFSGEFPVLSDGSIATRFGRLVVAGKTIEQAKADLTKLASKRLKNPTVDLLIHSQRPDLVYVLGEKVQGSGPRPYYAGLSVKQLLADLNLPMDLEVNDVSLSRGGKVIWHAKLLDVVRGIMPDLDPPLMPDDVVSVTSREQVRVWVIGEVALPGPVKIAEGDNVYQAIAKAGGFAAKEGSTPQAVAEADVLVTLRRGPDSIQVPFRADPTADAPKVESGDTIYVQSPRPIRIRIIGEVRTEGEYVMKEGSTITSAIAVAGGLSDKGSMTSIMLFRDNEAISIDASGALTGSKPNFELKDGDLVVFRSNPRYAVVLGKVNRPGRVLFEDGKDYQLSDVLAEAGGITERGTLRRVHIGRKGEDGKIVITQYNLDEYIKSGKLTANPRIEPGDVVMFDEKRELNISTISQVISSALLLDSLFRR